jgi:hypothetical protein
MTLHKFTFDTMGEAIKGAEAPKVSAWQERTSRRDNDSEWNGSKTFDDAIKLARHGWPEGRAKMAKAVAVAASTAGFARAPAFDLDMCGAYPIAALAAAGDPLCMVNPSPVSERAKPIVKLVVAASVSSMVSANDIFNYGAALLAFVDGLEQADVRVELTVCYASRAYHDEKNQAAILVGFKQADEALDLDRAAFALASPAMFRRLVFSIYELNLPQEFEYGYGIPRDPKAGHDFEADAILLPSCQSFRGKLASPAEAFKVIAPTIETLLQDRYANFPPLSFEAR